MVYKYGYVRSEERLIYMSLICPLLIIKSIMLKGIKAVRKNVPIHPTNQKGSDKDIPCCSTPKQNITIPYVGIHNG